MKNTRKAKTFGKWLCGVTLAFGLFTSLSAAAERRVAFVVGNGDYQAVPQLPNPANDAAAVAEALLRSGFEVISAIDLDHAALEAATLRFARSLENAEVSVFYYSGHGIEVNGDNRMIPIDASLKSPADLELQTISMQTIVRYMQSNSKAQIVYLDACRNNPFPQTAFLLAGDKGLAEAGKGLAAQKGSVGSLIAYATQPGNVALDGDEKNSPFTKAVLKRSFAPGIDVQTALMQVTQDVWAATGEKQRPWSTNTLVKPVVLNTKLQSRKIVIGETDQPNDKNIAIVPKIETGQLKKPPAEVKEEIEAEAVPVLPEEEQEAEAVPVQPAAEQEVEAVAVPRTDQLEQEVEAVAVPRADQPEQEVAEITAEVKTGSSQVQQFSFESPIGVGPVKLFTGSMPKGIPDSGNFSLSNLPTSGVLYVGGTAITQLQEFPLASLADVVFEPAIGSETKPVNFAFNYGDANGQASQLTFSTTPHNLPCDIEAAEPLDLQGVVPGKLPNEIDVAAAGKACQQALSDYPEIGRFKYQLGRAALAEKKTDVAVKLFELAAEDKHIRANYELGYMTQRGLGVQADLKKANVYFAQSAEAGDPFGMLSYGRNLVKGRGVSKNIDDGLAYLNRAVEMGHTYAMNELGAMYYYGQAVKENPQRAIRFYEASMARNDIYGIHNMGLAYLEGKGVDKDLKIALALFNTASIGGHPNAPLNIAIMYYNGNGVKKSLGEALKWYELGAERGNMQSASNLAWIYAKGPKAKRNEAKAVWFTALALALDTYNANGKDKANLTAFPDAAKSQAVKDLIAFVGPENVETADDLDQTLILLARKAWQIRNPRLDLF